MKTSNLLGILAIGGIGYYLLKNKKTALTPIAISEIPIVDTTEATKTSVVSNTGIVSNPKIENALAPLAITEPIYL